MPPQSSRFLALETLMVEGFFPEPEKRQYAKPAPNPQHQCCDDFEKVVASGKVPNDFELQGVLLIAAHNTRRIAVFTAGAPACAPRRWMSSDTSMPQKHGVTWAMVACICSPGPVVPLAKPSSRSARGPTICASKLQHSFWPQHLKLCKIMFMCTLHLHSQPRKHS